MLWSSSVSIAQVLIAYTFFLTSTLIGIYSPDGNRLILGRLDEDGLDDWLGDAERVGAELNEGAPDFEGDADLEGWALTEGDADLEGWALIDGFADLEGLELREGDALLLGMLDEVGAGLTDGLLSEGLADMLGLFEGDKDGARV